MKSQFPGSLSETTKVTRILRVNQAGEYGAMQIYQGQLDALKYRSQHSLNIIQRIKDQEQRHLSTFNNMIIQRRIRPTILSPIWHIAGYTLGFITGRLGEKAAMACTVAIEEVIDQHYADQLDELKKFPHEKELIEIVTEFRLEELEHRDIGLQEGAKQAPFYKWLTRGIKVASKTAIWLSKRF